MVHPRPIGLTALMAAALTTTGCAGDLSADSSCRDFMHASGAAQDDAVSRVASDLGARGAVTPLGRPNINYLCAGHPDWTLGEAVERTG